MLLQATSTKRYISFYKLQAQKRYIFITDCQDNYQGGLIQHVSEPSVTVLPKDKTPSPLSSPFLPPSVVLVN